MRRLGLLVPLLLLATIGLDAPAGAASCESILEAAAGSETMAASHRSVVYEGGLTDLRSGDLSRFVLTAQGGDQLLYVVHDGAGKEIVRWGYDRGRAWGFSGDTGLQGLEGDSLQSWRLLAILLSPNRFSSLVREAVDCALADPTETVAPVLRLIIEGGTELLLTLELNPYRLLRVERLADGVRRTTVFVRAESVDKEVQLEELRTLRDGVPHALFRFESISYGPPIPAAFCSADSIREVFQGAGEQR